MTTMNISLPEEMKAWVDEQVQKRAYASSSEFFRDLIRRHRDADAFRAMILDGVNSGTSDQPYRDWLVELKAKYDQ